MRRLAGSLLLGLFVLLAGCEIPGRRAAGGSDAG